MSDWWRGEGWVDASDWWTEIETKDHRTFDGPARPPRPDPVPARPPEAAMQRHTPPEGADTPDPGPDPAPSTGVSYGPPRWTGGGRWMRPVFGSPGTNWETLPTPEVDPARGTYLAAKDLRSKGRPGLRALRDALKQLETDPKQER
jgi:hypothetical protein